MLIEGKKPEKIIEDNINVSSFERKSEKIWTNWSAQWNESSTWLSPNSFSYDLYFSIFN